MRVSLPSNRSSFSPRLYVLALLLAGAVFGGTSVNGRQQSEKDQTIKLNSDLVVVNASVVDVSGKNIQELRKPDFRIEEDGKPQTIDSFASDEAPFAAAILIDMSGSMEYKFGMVRGAAAAFLDHIRDDDQVAVYGFNDKVRQFQDFSNLRDLSDYIWDAKAQDQTRLYDCMDQALDALSKRAERRRAILVITDGVDTTSKVSLDHVTKKALNEAVTIFTVDITDDDLLRTDIGGAAELRRGRAELQQIARDTGGRFVHSPQGDSLEDAFTQIVDALRNQYTLVYYSTNPKHDGRYRKITVTVARPDSTALTRRGYYAPSK